MTLYFFYRKLNYYRTSKVIDRYDHMQAAARYNNVEFAEYCLLADYRMGFSTEYNKHNPSFYEIALSRGSREVVEFLNKANLTCAVDEKAHLQYNFINSVLNREYKKMAQYIRSGADIFQDWFNGCNALEYVCKRI